MLVLAIITVCVAGALIRLHPLAQSDLPYHLDGILEGRYAEYIAVTGTLNAEAGTSYGATHTIYTPAYDVFLALTSLITHEQPISMLQALLAPITVLTLLGCYTLAHRLSAHRRVGVVTMMAMAAYGPFVFVTQGTWKEVFGIAFIPFIFVTFYLREDIRMRIISSSLIFFLPLIHHLVAIIVLLGIAFASVSGFLLARRARTLGSTNVIDILVTVIAIDELFLYYALVRFDRLEYLTPENGLYLFIGLAILMALGIYYLGIKCLSETWRKTLWISATSITILLLFIGILSPLFTEESMSFYIISAPLIASLVLVVLGIFGISLWASSRSTSKTIFFAIFAAPLTLIIYAFLRAVDLQSYNIISRTVDFIDLGIMIGLGTFLVYELKGQRRRSSFIMTSLICVLLITSLPIAIDPEKYLGVRNNICEFEVDGIEWVTTSNNLGEIQTDRHYSAVARNLFDIPEDSTIIRRFMGALDFESNTLMIASERWVTKGTNDHPFGWIQIEMNELQSILDQSNVLYVGGPQKYEIIIFISPT